MVAMALPHLILKIKNLFYMMEDLFQLKGKLRFIVKGENLDLGWI